MIKLHINDRRLQRHDKITINMLSQADLAPGQGVSSAYHEQVNLVKNLENFEVFINEEGVTDIVHHHTINPSHYLKMNDKRSIHVAYCHFLPETLDGSIRLPKPIFSIFKDYVIRFYRKADYLVVVNPIFIEMLVSYGIDRNKIVYIPNFVSKEEFYKLTDEEIFELKTSYGYQKDDFIVLGVGQVQTRKGVMDFIEVAKAMPQTEFLWAGGFSFGAITDGYEELKEVYENPPANVKFIGIVDREDMNDIYNLADVLFMPSYNELFPMSILEAINSSTPLLLRDLELYEEILFKGYLKASSNSEFVKKIKQLQNDESFYAIQEDISQSISEYYSKEHVGEMWHDFYLDIFNHNYKAE